jgi:mono/diheme cytochrome c family protein
MKHKQWMLLLSVGASVLTGLAVMNGCGNDDDDEGNQAFDDADPVRGGQLYDKWWDVPGVLDGSEPTSSNPGYALTQGTRTGPDTWRCKECHGWDYRGRDGAYAEGSSRHTGVAGLTHASGDPADELFETVKEGLAGSAMSSFKAHLSDADIWDIVKFLKEAMIDETQLINYETKTPIGANSAHGQSLFSSTCAICHGSDGKQLNFGDAAEPEYVGTVASDNPWEFLHKVRFGQPGAAMPSAIRNGWSVQDAVDVLGYAQTLPAE